MYDTGQLLGTLTWLAPGTLTSLRDRFDLPVRASALAT